MLSVDKKYCTIARYPLLLNNSYFDNKEGGIEGGRWVKRFEHIENLNIKWQDSLKIQ